MSANTDVHMVGGIPRAGSVVSMSLSLLTVAALAVCLTQRIQAVHDWTKVPVTRWLVLAIYTDALVFITSSNILEHGFGLDSTSVTCSAAILLCLACYLSTKAVCTFGDINLVLKVTDQHQLIYYFLVERVYIIRLHSVHTARLKSRLYCFNCFVVLLSYLGVIVLNFVFRIANFKKDGSCVIGMEVKSLIPLIIFDAFLNLYLTLCFVLPLRRVYSYQSNPGSPLRALALRSFIGSVGILASALGNLTTGVFLHGGEAAWICLMACNAEILVSVLILHWVTVTDKSTSPSAFHFNPREANKAIPTPITGIIKDTIDMFRYPRISQLETSGTSFPPNHDVNNNNRLQDIEVGLDEGNGIEYPFWIVTTDLENAVGIQGSQQKGRNEDSIHERRASVPF